MAFQPFKVIKNIINGLNKPSSVLRGAVLPSGNYKTIASAAKGIINYNPTNADYSSVRHRKSSDSVYVYPLDHKDQEHYILFDIIEREKKKGETGAVSNQGITKRADNLNKVVYGANRFFGEGGHDNVWGGLSTGTGSHRTIRSSIAIYMPQTLKFNLQADYGAEEIGLGLGLFSKLKETISEGGLDLGADMKAVAMQGAKALSGVSSFASGGLAAGINAVIQRRTGLAPAAMTEMIFNGIDYRTFSFTFKFTPRSKQESDVVNNLLHEIKEAMLPEKVGKSASIAAYQVPHEFVIRFMKGMHINPYIDQIGLCACTGVEIDYGSDKFSTHASGDPVSIDATISFKELELMERARYNQLRDSASERPPQVPQ